MTTTTTAIDSIKLEDTLNKTWKNGILFEF